MIRVRVGGRWVTRGKGVLDRLVERGFADLAFLFRGVIVLLVSRHAFSMNLLGRS
jgi:hypothetical protein